MSLRFQSLATALWLRSELGRCVVNERSRPQRGQQEDLYQILPLDSSTQVLSRNSGPFMLSKQIVYVCVWAHVCTSAFAII